jgi:hypothetical protein
MRLAMGIVAAKDGAFFRETLLENAAYVSGTGVDTRENIARQVETNTCTVDGFILRNQEVRSLSPDVAVLTLRAMSAVWVSRRSGHLNACIPSPIVSIRAHGC